MPFMFVAGDHAKNDIAGDWKEELEKKGYEVSVFMEGLGQNPDIQKIFIEHARFMAKHKMIDIVDKKKAYAVEKGLKKVLQIYVLFLSEEKVILPKETKFSFEGKWNFFRKGFHMHTINSYNAKYMKRVLTILPLTALCISTMQAQHKNEYTNFADTTFNIQEVVATAARKPRPQITKLDVPMKYLPISINSITASSLELRGIRNIQDAVRFMPGVRFQTSYGAFQQLSIRGFDHSIMMIDGIRDERSAINNSYPVPDLCLYRVY
mgnify:CR=1 FL=1